MSKEIFLQQGQKLNNAFTLQEKLGEQKNSTVFKAAYQLSPEVSKEVAVKIIKLSGNQTDRETQLHQFRREAEILTFLRHQNIVPFYLHDMHTQQNRYGVDEHPYIVMEHAEEGSVRNLMGRYKNNEIEKGKQLVPIYQ